MAECSIRGGEYVAFDHADLQSALRVWLQAAQSGDAEAQTYVGDIYERGLGVAPDHASAAQWYRKAADQGFSRALFNLGTLYEQGLGVPQDQLKALNLYRQAWGLAEDNIIFASAAQREQDALRAELETAIAEKSTQMGLLEKQLKALQDKLAEQPTEQSAQVSSNAEVEALRKWIAQLESERRRSTERLAGIPRTRTPQGTEMLTPIPPKADERSMGGMNFGRYYAIVIGNQDYQTIEDLETPRYDAARAARILATSMIHRARSRCERITRLKSTTIKRHPQARGQRADLLRRSWCPIAKRSDRSGIGCPSTRSPAGVLLVAQ